MEKKSSNRKGKVWCHPLARQLLVTSAPVQPPCPEKNGEEKVCSRKTPVSGSIKRRSEFTELAKSRFLDCDSYGMTQGAF